MIPVIPRDLRAAGLALIRLAEVIETGGCTISTATAERVIQVVLFAIAESGQRPQPTGDGAEQDLGATD